MSSAPDTPVDPYTRWGVYATFGLYVVGLATLVAGLTGVADVVVPGFFLWVVAQVAVGLSTLADAFVLGREGVEWSRRRYLYAVGSWVVPPLVVLYVVQRRRRVRKALRRREGGDAAADGERPSSPSAGAGGGEPRDGPD